MAAKNPTWYMTFGPDGAGLAGGYTPDGTVPADVTVCTQEQAERPAEWKLSGGAIVALQSPARLIAYANDRQWSLATGGYAVMIAGQRLRFATDPQSHALIAGKVARFARQPTLVSVDWQFAEGFVTVAAADFIVAADQVDDFVQATFDTLKVVLAGITAGTITTSAEIDAAAWPASVAA